MVSQSRRPLRLLPALPALLAAVAVLPACTLLGSANTPGKVGQSCVKTNDCGYAESCVTGLCAPGFCRLDTDCGTPGALSCCGSRCIPAGDTCSAGCVTDSDCGGGVCALGRCVTPCSRNDQCPNGETCIPLLNVCLPNFTGNNPLDGDLELPLDGDLPENLDDLDLPFDIPNDLPFDIPDGFPGDLPFDLPFEIPTDIPGVPTQDCNSSADCTTGECVGGFCVNLGGPGGGRCSQDFDCGTGQRCLGGVCVGQPSSGPCETQDDCGGGICIPGVGVCIGGQPGGSRRCASQADCTSSEECLFGLCLPTGNVSPGGDGESTETGNTRCQSDADCAADRQCLFGFCAPVRPGGDTESEMPERDRDREPPPPGGGTTSPCNTDADCPNGGMCFQGLCVGTASNAADTAPPAAAVSAPVSVSPAPASPAPTAP